MLIDELLPAFHIQTKEEIAVTGTAGMIFNSIRDIDLSDSNLVTALFRVRGLPRSALCIDGLLALGFIELGELPSREYVMGIVGQFWKPSGSLIRIAPEEFPSFSRVGYSKAAWNFSVQTVDSKRCRLETETRVATYGGIATALFRTYWLLIAPFSKMIRQEMLELIKNNAEQGFDIESA